MKPAIQFTNTTMKPAIQSHYTQQAPKILIIEDRKETLYLLVEILEKAGYEVYPVQDSSQSFQSVVEQIAKENA